MSHPENESIALAAYLANQVSSRLRMVAPLVIVLLVTSGCTKRHPSHVSMLQAKPSTPPPPDSPLPPKEADANPSEAPAPAVPTEYACRFSAHDFEMASVASFRLPSRTRGDVEAWIPKHAKAQPAQARYRNSDIVLWGDVEFELAPRDRNFLGEHVFHNTGTLTFTDLGDGKIQVAAALPSNLSLVRNAAVMKCDDLALRPRAAPPAAIAGGDKYKIAAPTNSTAAGEIVLRFSKKTIGGITQPDGLILSAATQVEQTLSGWLSIDGWYIHTVIPSAIASATRQGIARGAAISSKTSTRRCNGIVAIYTQENRQIGWFGPGNIKIISNSQAILPANHGTGLLSDTSPGLRKEDIARHCDPEQRSVGSTVFLVNRISGDVRIQPGYLSKFYIVADGAKRLGANFKVCVNSSGTIDSVTLIGNGTGYGAYDAKLIAATRMWRFRPFLVNGTAAPTCSLVRFVYIQR